MTIPSPFPLIACCLEDIFPITISLFSIRGVEAQRMEKKNCWDCRTEIVNINCNNVVDTQSRMAHNIRVECIENMENMETSLVMRHWVTFAGGKNSEFFICSPNTLCVLFVTVAFRIHRARCVIRDPVNCPDSTGSAVLCSFRLDFLIWKLNFSCHMGNATHVRLVWEIKMSQRWPEELP